MLCTYMKQLINKDCAISLQQHFHDYSVYSTAIVAYMYGTISMKTPETCLVY